MPTTLERVPKRPTGRVDAVLDTDAYNEIDDQFAIALLLKCPEKVNLRQIYAAPFFNSRSASPEDGMEKSYNEILRLLALCGKTQKDIPVFRGSRSYLSAADTPVESEAARALIAIASEYTADNPLYVVTIGCVTNVASALLMAPEIAEKIVLVSLIGNAYHWEHANAKEFNLWQDLHASRVLFSCDAPFVQLPCMGIVSSFTTTKPELEYWLSGKNPLAEHLASAAIEEADSYAEGQAWSRVIWDVTAAAWLLDPDGRYMKASPRCCMMPTADGTYHEGDGRYCLYVTHIWRDRLMTDLFRRMLGE